MTTTPAGRTAAAIAARRQRGTELLGRVDRAVDQIRREGARVTVAAVARRAGVSSTFLYENAAARASVRNAAVAAEARRDQVTRDDDERRAATWRERALNAEHELSQAQKEILAQRQHIAELMGQLRDLDNAVTGESVQHLVSENTSLKQQVRSLTQDNRTVKDRLEAARSSNRFLDRRVAELEAQIVDIGGGSTCSN